MQVDMHSFLKSPSLECGPKSATGQTSETSHHHDPPQAESDAGEACAALDFSANRHTLWASYFNLKGSSTVGLRDGVLACQDVIVYLQPLQNYADSMCIPSPSGISYHLQARLRRLDEVHMQMGNRLDGCSCISVCSMQALSTGGDRHHHLLLSLNIEAGQAKRESSCIAAAANHRRLLSLEAPMPILPRIGPTIGADGVGRQGRGHRQSGLGSSCCSCCRRYRGGSWRCGGASTGRSGHVQAAGCGGQGAWRAACLSRTCFKHTISMHNLQSCRLAPCWSSMQTGTAIFLRDAAVIIFEAYVLKHTFSHETEQASSCLSNLAKAFGRPAAACLKESNAN